MEKKRTSTAVEQSADGDVQLVNSAKQILIVLVASAIQTANYACQTTSQKRF
jgi:hypothetical protein